MQSFQTFRQLRQKMWLMKCLWIMCLFWGQEKVCCSRVRECGCRQRARFAGRIPWEERRWAVLLHFAVDIYALLSLLSQFGKHFQVWQDHSRKDKWVGLWKIKAISLYSRNALACLSNPVPRHIDKSTTSSSDYQRKEPASCDLFHSCRQS